MQLAIDENGDRILPYKNGRATCKLCGGLLIAHCGEIRVDHWQHYGQRREDCDTWKEPETEWHRAWKERFPKEWREIVIGNHRADVKTPFDLVLEFQNSPISPSVIREREEFYGNMFWIINAANFDENLMFRSNVKHNLRRHDKETEQDAREALREIDREIGQAETKRGEANKDSIEARNKVNWKRGELQDLKKHLSESRKIARNVAVYDPNGFGSFYWRDPSREIAPTLDQDLLREAATRLDKGKAVEKEIEQVQAPLKTIRAFPDFDLACKPYKIVQYKDLNAKNYQMASPVLKSTMYHIFPDVRSFASETDFMGYKYKQTDYIFIVDLAPKIMELETNLAKLEKELETVSGEIETDLDTLEKCVLAWLENRINEKKGELERLETELEEAENAYQYYKRKVERLTEEKPFRGDAIIEEMEQAQERERGKIMQTYKGRYTLTDWKHERKSWQAAKAVLHFDTGKGYLLVQTYGNEYKKVTIDEFVSEIMGFDGFSKKNLFSPTK